MTTESVLVSPRPSQIEPEISSGVVWGMKRLNLHGKRGEGKVTLVDDDVFEWARKCRWYLDRHGYVGTIYGNRKTATSFLLHRKIMLAESGTIVDHRNRDPLDNRRVNLRFATPAQSASNIGLRKDSVSGIRGVSWKKKDRRWQAQIQSNGKYYYLGQFKDKSDAAEAYGEAAKEMFGDFAG